MTLAEKILAKNAGLKETHAGEIITAYPECAMMDDILGPRVVETEFAKMGGVIRHPDRTVIICDHYTPSATVNQADIVVYTRNWAEKHGIKNYFEGKGPCHQVLAEHGFSFPGTLQVGTDSHTCTAGAFGCFGTGVGSTELAGVLALGEIWLRVPETLRIIWDGVPGKGVMAKDIILKTIGTVGHAGATYMAMQFDGSTIRALPMDERMCISNMAVEAGAKAGLIAPDEKTRAYLQAHGCDRDFEYMAGDEDASYARTITFDAAELIPQVACPHNVDNVKPITEVVGTRIHQAYLGSCTGGRLSDLEAAANILRGKQIASNCRLLVSPASPRIWREASRSGILNDLADAGAVILAPTCGACLGVHSGVIGGGENCVSTTNRNFRGRMGSREGGVYLASAATLAASALRGELADPREFI